jgi:tetratricopeptide (TPR) repeat protein
MEDIENLYVYFLSNIFAENKQFELSSRVLESYLRKIPYDKELKGELSYLYSKMGIQIAEAIKYAMEGLEAFPNHPKFTYALGWAYFQQFQLNHALTYLLQAHYLWDSLESSSTLGYVYYCMGDLESAQKWYSEALKKSSSPEFQKKLQQIETLKKSNE